MAEIVWCVTTKGKRMPVDVIPDPGGNVVLSTMDGELHDGDMVEVDAGPTLTDRPDIIRLTSHFATCPEAASFRKPR
jgi:hypothetical protein